MKALVTTSPSPSPVLPCLSYRDMGDTALVKRQQDHYEYVPILLKNKHLYH